MMSLRRPVISKCQLACLIITATVCLSCDQHSAEHIQSFAFATASPGGTFDRIGKGVAAAFHQASPDDNRMSLAWRNTSGTLENVEALSTDASLYFALASGHGLKQIDTDPDTHEQLNDVTLVASLFPSFLQIVVRNERLNAMESTPSDFEQFCKQFSSSRDDQGSNPEQPAPESLRIYATPTTRAVASELLQLIGLAPADYTFDDTLENNDDAALSITAENGIDIGFFFAGVPTPAVESSLLNGCTLLPLAAKDSATLDEIKAMQNATGNIDAIDPFSYSRLTDPVLTLTETNYLICRPDTPDLLVRCAIRALVENIDTIRYHHPLASQIRLDTLLDAPNAAISGLDFHPAARDEHGRIQNELVLLAGPSSGVYYSLAHDFRQHLRQHGIPCHVQETEGSLENVRLLALDTRRPRIAFVQHDVAFRCRQAAILEDRDEIARLLSLRDDDVKQTNLNALADLRRIATLQNEFLFTFVGEQPEARKPHSFADLVRKHPDRVYLGSPLSGTRFMVDSILPPRTSEVQIEIPPERIGAALQDNTIWGAALVSSFESPLVQSLFASDAVVPVDLTTLPILPHSNPAIEQFEFPARSKPFGALAGNASSAVAPIATVRTQALLVCHHGLPMIHEVTEAVYKTDAFLGLPTERVAAEVIGLDTHPATKIHLEGLGLLPTRTFDIAGFLQLCALLIGVATALYGMISGLMKVYLGHVEANRILAIDLGADTRDSVAQLWRIEEELRKNVGKASKSLNRLLRKPAYLLGGVITPARWASLQELINLRKAGAQEATFRLLVSKARAIKSAKGGRGEQQARLLELEASAFQLLEAGELPYELYDTLTSVIARMLCGEEDSAEKSKHLQEILHALRRCVPTEGESSAQLDDKEVDLNEVVGQAVEALGRRDIAHEQYSIVDQAAWRIREAYERSRARAPAETESTVSGDTTPSDER